MAHSPAETPLFVLADDKHEVPKSAILKHMIGRLPVIVNTTNFDANTWNKRINRAQDMDATMVITEAFASPQADKKESL